MTAIPDAAIEAGREAAAKAMFGQEQCDRRQMLDVEGNWESRLNEQDQADYRDLARAAIEAAMPAIQAHLDAKWAADLQAALDGQREAIAQEIEADRVCMYSCQQYAARLVRGGTP